MILMLFITNKIFWEKYWSILEIKIKKPITERNWADMPEYKEILQSDWTF